MATAIMNALNNELVTGESSASQRFLGRGTHLSGVWNSFPCEASRGRFAEAALAKYFEVRNATALVRWGGAGLR